MPKNSISRDPTVLKIGSRRFSNRGLSLALTAVDKIPCRQVLNLSTRGDQSHEKNFTRNDSHHLRRRTLAQSYRDQPLGSSSPAVTPQMDFVFIGKARLSTTGLDTLGCPVTSK